MKYRNAKNVLPKDLISEIQKYVSGGLIYIPKEESVISSDYRLELMKRNQLIMAKFKNKTSVYDLADEFYLSPDSIKKIVYSKANSKLLEYQPSIESALSFDKKGLLEEWLHSHLLINDHNQMYSDYIMDNEFLIFGIVQLPLRLITSHNESSDVVEQPLIVEFSSKEFTCISGSNIFLKQREKKINAYPAIIIVTKNDSETYFMNNYGRHLKYL